MPPGPPGSRGTPGEGPEGVPWHPWGALGAWKKQIKQILYTKISNDIKGSTENTIPYAIRASCTEAQRGPKGKDNKI